MTEKKVNRSFPRKFRSSKDNSCDHSKIDLKDGSLFNFLKIFSEICTNDDEPDSKILIAYLNVLVYLSKDLLSQFEKNDYFIISIYSIVKYSLWHACRLVRTAGLRCMRYYMLSYRHAELFLRMRIDYLIMRSLDLSYDDAMNNQYRGSDDAERIQSIRLIYRLCLIAPKLFPLTLINTLVGICLIDIDKNTGTLDLAIRPALMIMCNIVNINPAVATNSRILDALQVVIFNADGKIWRLNFRIIEAVLLTQLKLVVHAQWRDGIPIGYFNKTLTPFSVLSKVQPPIKVENGYQMNFTDEQNDFENTSISVLCTILQSWSGLLYMCSANSKPILSITGILAVGSSEIRDRILDLLFQIFNIFRPPLDSCDFSSCMRSFIEQRSAKNNPNWSLDDEFLVAQCFDCLTYNSPSRINVLDNYEVILLGVFVHNNLFEALANAVADEKESTSARAGILLANISYKMSILFPSDHPLTRRSDTVKLFNNPKSHRALLWIDQVHKELENYQYEITPFMTYIIQQHPENHINEDFLFSKRYLQPSNIDDILDSSCSISWSIPAKKNGTLPRSSGNNRISALLDQITRHCRMFDSVTSESNSSYYDEWNWDLLLVLARSLVDSKLLVNLDKDLLSRVLKALMKFFTPQANTPTDCSDSKNTSMTFASLPLTWKNSSKAAFVITDILTFMVEFDKSSEPQDDLNFFLFTIRSYLCGSLKSVISSDKLIEITEHYDKSSLFIDVSFSEYDLTYKCSSYLILALGRLSASDLGEKCLEVNGFVELFKTLLDHNQSDVYAKLILGSLDYARPSLGRSLLSVASSSINLATRRYSVKFLRVLLRAKVPFFANWAINLLLKLIHDPDSIVKKAAFDILQESCEDESVINNLSVDSMAILQLGYPGFMLFSRLFSLPFHFEALLNRNSINSILDEWHEKHYDYEYCRQLDELLMQHFTSYDIQTYNSDDPDEGRLSNRARFKSKELILPCHPYSSLAAHKDGLDWLLNRGFLEDCEDMLQKEHKNIIEDQNFGLPGHDVSSCDSKELMLRSNMLAICHITTSSWGLDCAINMEVPRLISDITKFHPSVNVRGTGILCLGIIGSTPRGANILIKLNWMALRSDRFDKWPLLLDVYHHLYQTREEVKRQLQSGTEPFNKHRSNSITSGSTDCFHDQQIESGAAVGFSVFALPLATDDPSQRNRKVTYNLTESGNEITGKGYSKSVDENMVRSKTATMSSSSSYVYSVEDDKTSKYTKLINHHRDLSTGAASMFNVQLEDSESLISPHDVLGIATMRRIQKKSRTGLFENTGAFNRFSVDCNQSDVCDQTACGANMDIFSNIRKTSIMDRFTTRRRKKFSSLITPKSNLSKYRGLVVPINFIDLTINVLPMTNPLSSKVSGSDLQNNIRFSMLSYSDDSESQHIAATVPSTSTQSSKMPYLNSKGSESFSVRSQDNAGVSYPTFGTSGYISLEENSCVLDLAILAVNNKQDDGSDINKTQRSSSDQNHPVTKDRISLRPRATTTSICQDQHKSTLYPACSRNNECYSIPDIVISTRDSEMFVGENIPKIHELRNGLTYHHCDYCLHLGCSAEKDDPVSDSIVEFRKEILYAASSLIVLSAKTKKMEMGLAKLKSSQSPTMWSDLCLYSEICILLSLYNYSRQSRLYLQDLFISVPMTKLKDDMKSCLEEFSQQSGSRYSQSTRL